MISSRILYEMEDFSFLCGVPIGEAIEWKIARLWWLIEVSEAGNIVSPIVKEYAENGDFNPISSAGYITKIRLDAIDFWSTKLSEVNKNRKGKKWILFHLMAMFLPDSLKPLKRKLSQVYTFPPQLKKKEAEK